LDLAGEKDLPVAHDIMLGKIYPLVEDIAKSAEWLTATGEKALQTSRAAAAQQVSATFWEAFCFAALALVAGMGGLWIARASMLTLRRNARELKEVSSQVASAAEQISVSNQSLAQSTSEQAASVEEASASTEEIGAIARKDSENSRTAVQLMLAGAESISEAECHRRLGDDEAFRRYWPRLATPREPGPHQKMEANNEIVIAFFCVVNVCLTETFHIQHVVT